MICIRFTLTSVLCLIVVLFYKPPVAQGIGLESTEASCLDSVIVVLPIVGWPKGKEPIHYRGIISERMVQELPCAFVDHAILPGITQVFDNSRTSLNQENVIDRLAELITENREQIEQRANQFLAGLTNTQRKAHIRIYGGFYDEFFGNTAITFVDFRSELRPVSYKLTVLDGSETQGAAFLAKVVRGDAKRLLEDILGESSRIPVTIEPVESLDQDAISEKIANEVSLFVRSRFVSPIAFSLFERKAFFRDGSKAENPQYSLTTKIRRESTRFYGAVTAQSSDGSRRRTAWVEGDLSRFGEFEEEILATGQKNLALIEGISDYALFAGADFLLTKDENTRLFLLTFRQNLGNAAFGLRMRLGQRSQPGNQQAQRLFLLGGTAGWQFLDFRWLVADAGLSIDGGFVDYNSVNASTSTQSLLTFVGPYVQSQIVTKKNLSFIGGCGMQLPQLLNQSSTENRFPLYFFNLFIAAGLTF